MIDIESAEKIIEKTHVKPGIENISINDSLGRILGEDIISPLNMPPFNKSAMDGYAISSNDNSDKFKIIEIIAAGYVPKKKINKGECAKIMTGGMIPEGADKVIKKEVTLCENDYMKVTGDDPHNNICYKGEDVKTGDTVLKKSILIRPQEIAVFASMGRREVNVFKKPLVGVAATGSELIEPGIPLPEGCIYNSNSYSLSAQIKATGASVLSKGVVKDDKNEIKYSIQNLLETCDMILLSGGVSMGDFDYIPAILKELSVTLFFEKIAIKPGKPTVFGIKGNIPVFGVPGNPVSTFVIFEIFIKPLLYRMMGLKYKANILKGRLNKSFKRKHAERCGIIPVRYEKGEIMFLPYHGSAHIHALTKANSLLKIPRGVEEIQEGSVVDVRQV